ncbi:serine/threonine-protein phosphatase 2A activator-like [Centruroides sculpturatus]|uniref:serine/threonine-protein phosphatase 2A activator-like n=1 Tax=Centruroides sculpturatus TaxID=218467 RepID=UPI000C6CE2F6|nr:serine/threonine-protein phosphatase 2A activator-like [Centruroides sculpturatus]
MSGENMSEEPKDYVTPVRKIMAMSDMPKWEKSEAYSEYMGFILAMNEAVKGKKISDAKETTPAVDGIISLLEKLQSWIVEIPPIQQPQRFGNKAFTQWYNKLKDNVADVLKEALSAEFHGAIIEISSYLQESFGNSTRIDYGTGHEISFAMFLYCLFKIGVFQQSDALLVILKIFNRYIALVRELQQTYRMEPAGSHGVWSLDDYHFLPFIWGSSQLINHPKLEPKSFTDSRIASENANEYMFMGCIEFINKVKTGPFYEHSNTLWNVSGAASWGKVNSGLIKMYKAEVLSKFPVMQHVVFGSILPFRPHLSQ